MSDGEAAPPQVRQLSDPEEFHRLLWRLARELQERHPLGDGVLLCGIVTRGVFLAERLRQVIREQGGGDWAGAHLDVGPYRDDEPRRPVHQASPGAGPFPLPAATQEAIQDKVVVLVDDVLYHGRTAKAALVALSELGRPRAVELLVLVDRGHRELPLRATYVGRNLPTAEAERVSVRILGCDQQDVILLHPAEAAAS